MKPPFSYFGGKCRMSKHILPLLPLHACYVEPFCGGAALLFAKPRPSWPNYVEVLNDIDRHVSNFFAVLRDPVLGADLVRRIYLTPLSEKSHRKACKALASSDFEDRLDAAYWFYVNVEQSFGNVLSGGWRRSVTSSEAKAWANASHWQRLWPYIDRLKEVQVANTDALKVIRQFDSPHTLTYCVPEDTLVLTPSGYAPIGTVQAGDALYLSTVEKRVDRRARETILSVTAMGTGLLPLRFSLEHKVPVWRDGVVSVIRAGDLTASDHLLIEYDTEVQTPPFPIFERIKIKQGKRKTGLYKPSWQGLAKLVGYFAAEGHVDHGSGLVFSFCSTEHDYLREVCDLLNDIFGLGSRIYEPCECPNMAVAQVRCHSRDLAHFFNTHLITGDCYTKKLMPWLMKLEPAIQIEILRAWLRGDGGVWSDVDWHPGKFKRSGKRNKHKITGTTTSLELANQMYQIALRCGLTPSIKKRGNGFDVYFTTLCDYNVITESSEVGRCCRRRKVLQNGLIATPITSIRREKFRGTLVDITTNTGYFHLLWNYKIHNCDPPYIGTAHGHYNRRGNKAFEMGDFEALVACLDECQGSIMLSTYDVPGVVFPDTWERFEFKASCTVSAVGKTALMGRQDRASKAVVTGRERTEVVWRRGPKVAPRPEIQKLYNSTSLFADVPNASRDQIRRKLFDKSISR